MQTETTTGTIRTEVLSSRIAQLVTILYLGVGVSYLWWRTTSTVNWDAPFISIPFLAADYLGFAFFTLFAMTLWRRVRRFAPPPAPGLTVDVLIPTYNEEVDVLRPTIEAAIAMDYPHRTYVLDDGRRAEIRSLCKGLGVEYLTREDNAGAKAGNINAALPRTSGDFIAIFDADHAPFKNFLTELLGYFTDDKVALVQAPQSYYNLDSFQHAPRVRSSDEGPWHEQSVFYDAILPGKDRWNAAFWCGSSAIVRRTALEEVGGVDTRTVTEDMHTAMLLHARGWKSIYHDRELAVGIAPEDASSFLVQRQRWAMGAVQILRKDNPLFLKGLTLRQRVSYFASVAYVFEYLPKAIYLATPAVALTIGALPMTNMGWNLLYRFLPYWLLGILATRLLTGGSNPYLQSERFHLLKLWIMLRACSTALWPRKLRFQVTPKSGTGVDHPAWNLRLIRWQLVVGVVSVAAASWAALAYWLDVSWKLTGPSLAMTAAWALFNAGMIAMLARSIAVRHHRRHVYRFPVVLPATFTYGRQRVLGTIVDLSGLGIGWESEVGLRRGSEVSVRVELDGDTAIRTRIRVLSTREVAGGFRHGGSFVALSERDRRNLILFLYQQHAPEMLTGQPGQLEPPIPFPSPDLPLRRAG
ncbi:MAG: glycosyltransferase [Tepidiformaceae bacterium]